MIILKKDCEGFPTHSDIAEIAKLGRLVDDLRETISSPSIWLDEAHDFPLLDDWSMSARYAPCLFGTAYGHPKFPGRQHPCITSELILFAPELGVARTRSRWFRLGNRVEAGEA